MSASAAGTTPAASAPIPPAGIEVIVVTAKRPGAQPIDEVIVTAKRPAKAVPRTPPVMAVEMPKLEIAVAQPSVIRL
jgi:hypothetical protein